MDNFFFVIRFSDGIMSNTLKDGTDVIMYLTIMSILNYYDFI